MPLRMRPRIDTLPVKGHLPTNKDKDELANEGFGNITDIKVFKEGEVATCTYFLST